MTAMVVCVFEHAQWRRALDGGPARGPGKMRRQKDILIAAAVLGCSCVDTTTRTAHSRNLKFTGLTQNLGQLEGSYRDFQSNCWVNLRILGQPCEFYLRALAARGAGYRGVPLERVVENTRFTAFPYQFELFNQPF
jgi:hypothetical protein